MKNWIFGDPRILEIRFEDLMASYDETFHKIFEHLQFPSNRRRQAVKITKQHDINRKSDAEIKSIGHVSSVKTNKWREYFDHHHKKDFAHKFGSVVIDLKYEKDDSWADA
jgi:hypothetical protein